MYMQIVANEYIPHQRGNIRWETSSFWVKSYTEMFRFPFEHLLKVVQNTNLVESLSYSDRTVSNRKRLAKTLLRWDHGIGQEPVDGVVMTICPSLCGNWNLRGCSAIVKLTSPQHSDEDWSHTAKHWTSYTVHS